MNSGEVSALKFDNIDFAELSNTTFNGLTLECLSANSVKEIKMNHVQIINSESQFSIQITNS